MTDHDDEGIYFSNGERIGDAWEPPPAPRAILEEPVSIQPQDARPYLDRYYSRDEPLFPRSPDALITFEEAREAHWTGIMPESARERIRQYLERVKGKPVVEQPKETDDTLARCLERHGSEKPDEGSEAAPTPRLTDPTKEYRLPF